MKILIADDHAVVREGLRQILAKLPDIKQIEEAATGSEALKKILSSLYDFVILDISLSDMSGLDVLKNLRLQNNETHVLVLSMHPEEQFAVRALKLGASGYVTKDKAGEELLTAIRKIASGGKYVSPELAEFMVLSLDNRGDILLHEKLSGREFQIMILLARGRSSQEIAKELFISPKTVGSHRARIMEKMGMKKNHELIFYATKNQLTE